MYKSFDMVLLTRSSKYGGFCVAGLDWETGAFVRLVTDDKDTNGALTRDDLTLDTGQRARPLDIVRVENAQPCPRALQTENYKIDREQRLKYLGTATLDVVLARFPQPERTTIFRGAGPVMRHGEAHGLDHSLELVHVQALTVYTRQSGGKPRTRADFELGGRRVENCVVTDPAHYSNSEVRRDIGGAWLVVSIADDPYTQFAGHYKFISAIYPDVSREKPVTRRRVIEHARGYLAQLSQGVDPIIGRPVDGDTLAEPRLRKCFAFVSDLLNELLENNGKIDLGESRNDAPPKKAQFHLTAAQRRGVYISPDPVTPSSFVKQVNNVVDASAMEKLSVRHINAWLLKNGYVTEQKQPEIIQRTVLRPVERAEALGLRVEDTPDPATDTVKSRLLLTREAQFFLLDHLDEFTNPKHA